MMNQKILNFYQSFKKSKFYSIVVYLIILIGLLYYPLTWPENNMFGILVGKYFNILIIGPYILLILMFIICLLYKNILSYIFILILLIPNLLALLVALVMGGKPSTLSEYLLFLIPGVFLMTNIGVAIFTYKYKLKAYDNTPIHRVPLIIGILIIILELLFFLFR